MAIKYSCDKCKQEIGPGLQVKVQPITTSDREIVGAKHICQKCLSMLDKYVKDFFNYVNTEAI